MPPRKKTAPVPARGTSAGDVDAFVRALDHPFKPAIEAIRALVLSLDPRIGEEVKWNAPSFRLADHFATFKLHPPTAVQLVLHTGARPKGAPRAFQVNDPAKLLKWVAPDRCVITLRSNEEAVARRDAIERIVRQWIEQLEP